MMPKGMRRKSRIVEKVETSTALHARRTIPFTRQNNSDHASATPRAPLIDVRVRRVVATNVNARGTRRQPVGACIVGIVRRVRSDALRRIVLGAIRVRRMRLEALQASLCSDRSPCRL